MILLVCGGRDYKGPLDALEKVGWPEIVIHGNSKGADKRAGAWFQGRGIHTAAVDALWDWYKKPAGYRRNAAMMILQPTHCIALPGGDGTAMMVKLCENAGVPIWMPYSVTVAGCIAYNGDPSQDFLL